MEVVRALTRGEAFLGHTLVLRMDHGRQAKDGASLVGAGSKEIRICSDHSQTSDDD